MSLEKLSIAFVAGTLGQGGAERQLYYILSALVAVNATPRVLCLTRGEYWESKIIDLGVPVTWVGRPPYKLMRLLRIISDLTMNPVDIVQSQHFYTNLYTAAAARALNIPGIGASRSDITNEIKANGKIYGPLSLRLPSLLAVNSKAGINNAIACGQEDNKLFHLPNVVDCDLFQPVSRDDEQDTIHLLSVGRLDPEKNMTCFLKIIARLVKLGTRQVRATIVGDGPLRNRLQQETKAYGLFPGTVRFTGTVPSPVSYYQNADIFLLTSGREGTPNVVLEAMACGLPVVAVDVGDVKEVVCDGETGFICSLGNEPDLYQKTLQLVNDHGLRINMGRKARQHVQNNFSLSRLPGYLEGLYQKAGSLRFHQQGQQT